MFTMVLKKIIKNKWMFISMLVGLILSTAMLSSIPIYTDGVMQKVLIKDLESFQQTRGNYPGALDIKLNMYNFPDKNYIKDIENVDNKLKNQIFNAINLPVLTNTNKLKLNVFNMFPEDEKSKKDVVMFAASDFQDHIKLTHGKMFSNKKDNDVIEVIASEEAMQKLSLNLDTVYTINSDIEDEPATYKVKLVGTFTNKDSHDSFWNNGLSEYGKGFVMDYSLFKTELSLNSISRYITSEWYLTYDYHKIDIENLNGIKNNLNFIEKWVNSNVSTDFRVPALEIITQYNTKQKMLRTSLLVLEMPILIMLMFYLFMISQLVIEQDKKEIAVLKSRGASKNYILLSYLLQSAILTLIAMAVGPPIGLLLCKIVGSSNGFMEFVQRLALPLKINLASYLYAICASIVFIITMLIPAFAASKTTIVLKNQDDARGNKKAFWKKYYLDIILFAISCYGIYAYKSQQKVLNITRVSGMDIPINPLLFAINSIFILSIGMVFLRIFPYIINFVFWIGRNRWKPAFYSSLIQISRSGSKNQFLILFLIITISTGLFSANAARTINTNTEEREKYDTGADITVTPVWQDNQPPESFSMAPPASEQNTNSIQAPKELIYKEPNFNAYTKLSGIEQATKVMVNNNVSFWGGGKDAKSAEAGFMAVIPNEFGKVAWFRNDLLKSHWYNYLNLLTKYPMGILVSSSMAKENNIKLGDNISVSLNSKDSFTGTVLAFIDYWPTYNPYPAKEASDGIAAPQSDKFIVGNLNYIQTVLPLRPYDIWLKKLPGATSSQVYNDIKSKKLNIVSIKDSSQNIVEQKNDPFVKGTNGALTLGFLVNLVVTFAGFLIFWILSIKSRTLQFGILRAMGLPLKQVVQMLLSELVIVSGSSIIMGSIIGGITSKLFVPLLQITGSSSQYVPPFKVTAFFGDYLKLYMVLLFMIISGFVVLASIISKINMNQALKLGED